MGFIKVKALPSRDRNHSAGESGGKTIHPGQSFTIDDKLVESLPKRLGNAINPNPCTEIEHRRVVLAGIPDTELNQANRDAYLKYVFFAPQWMRLDVSRPAVAAPVEVVETETETEVEATEENTKPPAGSKSILKK